MRAQGLTRRSWAGNYGVIAITLAVYAVFVAE